MVTSPSSRVYLWLGRDPSFFERCGRVSQSVSTDRQVHPIHHWRLLIPAKALAIESRAERKDGDKKKENED